MDRDPRYKIHEQYLWLEVGGYIETIHENVALYDLRTDPHGTAG
jgi:hypothetical protein